MRKSPDLPFLAFFSAKARKTTEKARIVLPKRTPKILGKEGKTLRNSLQEKTKNNKEFKKNKERKDKVLTNHHARGNKYTSNSWRFFDVYVFVLNSNSSTKQIFTYVFSCVTRCIPTNNRRYVYLVQINVALNFLCVCALNS